MKNYDELNGQEVEITAIKENETFPTKLKIEGVTSEEEALTVADRWCEENDSYAERVAWEDEDENHENTWFVRVVANDYE